MAKTLRVGYAHNEGGRRVTSNGPDTKPPTSRARCFFLVRDEHSKVHLWERGETRTECGLIMGDDWRRLPTGQSPHSINCPIYLARVVEIYG